ncbi:hypothetical protein BXP70_21485 [Hymenobacter crusticola]|uniref:Bacterial surface antigen (D15) domain-containing protein n=1 Tax=Hymenobacter crusticola TaxID=1770526 RepID=A0A243W911_9BACT|nr:hypothetical protein BXP70_21485 [Hymenobacter crusticola]
MLKAGLGIGRGFALDRYDGFGLPIVLGAEHRLTDKFTAYANVTSALQLVHGRASRYETFIRRGVVKLGGRYYYNQAGRMQHNRPVGPFIGNYLALQASTDLVPYRGIYDARTYLLYDYSAVSALWGMQRRLGNALLCDFSAGIGLMNQLRRRFNQIDYTFSSYRPLQLLPELNLHVSLAR